jgi:ABC-type bacteriocin/lantibiotic exporter with double-glycine peptidase domain
VQLAVPFVPQEKDTCGAASLAMVLQYWGLPADHEALAAAASEPGRRGIAGSRLVEAARGQGVFAIAYEGGLLQLKASLEKGRPVIVALGARGELLHDVVVVGFEDGRVLVHDPAEGRDRSLREGEFERRWSASSRWSLLVLPRR